MGLAFPLVRRLIFSPTLKESPFTIQVTSMFAFRLNISVSAVQVLSTTSNLLPGCHVPGSISCYVFRSKFHIS